MRSSRAEAREELVELTVRAAGAGRHPIPDSDLDDEQPVTVVVSAPLGLLRRAGLAEHYPKVGGS